MTISMNDSLEVIPTPSRLLGLECFKASNLWTPPGNRGVFGGQVIAQALMAAINTVDGLELHSTHAYFLLPCDSRQSVTYAVERLREGKSYSTRLVHAIQNSETIFTLTASFSRPPDPAGGRRWQLGFPENIRSYEESLKDLWADHILTMGDFGVKLADTEENKTAFFAANDRVMTSVSGRPQEGAYFAQRALWLCPELDGRRMTGNEIRAMIGYMTDSQAIATPGRAIGLSATSEPRLGMVATIDHTIHFYPLPSDYDGSQPILHIMETQVVDLASGRGQMVGRVYTKEGVLIATTSQEGVVRAQKNGVKARTESSRL
ncbi:hypothetical protein CspeluHIS016_0305720 [Cutaneotrichosporon spelunceum]|uniref:Thioesterase/thiol ester dehydrase-isomerase n=1 Tax=Cutaneotrichosporon spelunceum TaxID=1672016 RepID=A0AAD3TTR4_9TREE|nr:hypothetical protein CspeluHIS016_0305720 [Cutaneotrichosporon spelunceum]